LADFLHWAILKITKATQILGLLLSKENVMH
jgi:hypothetical protein